ncbi:FabD/lysophospholipase-like protein [Aaosphaeria arxii CBS 175.79]|uniref:FabD/lysophospholipase-like protein n=1 Tax=Aaosphaeria arxii CBS 175.79 TaxID=1450172 RepID=A0A6A5XG55_9PLEO|nr:FabD/lysophospholipase-like protein [Aaosphaeria arxii CBS 175.79]KAF2012215.1 FabD/lysophospholipase-like protein [Aaosphaeria arxii CBS 175.79]
MANSGIRRKDTTKGPPLRILSLDGGGVRGYSMLIILQELMHRTFVEIEGRAPKRHEIPKPCDHFDLIAGTGTGGLIAIMLGRLRLDVDTCKDVYVRMTKRVFETDKTFAGIPYRSTLFKASKLEEAIMECVREHTIYDDEGNDAPDAMSSSVDLKTPMTPGSAMGSVHRSPSTASRYSQIGMTPVNMRMAALKWGNPSARLYDVREERTKTAVTAVYKGSKKGGNGQILLRSYDSRKEPAIEPNATIWQAGRATCATALAFKPIQVGQSVFLDEGAGKYNPAPQILDEAVCNEWPGREVGVFISIGTGKRPEGTTQQQHLWWEDFVSSGVGDFAEARRRLIGKIEDCEKIHQSMKDHLAKRQVNPEHYYRLNVNVGVGEFGMNEWNRLAEISTNTRMYLSEQDVQSKNLDASAKLARIHRAKQRWERAERERANGTPTLRDPRDANSYRQRPLPSIPDAPTFAVELPAEDVTPGLYAHNQHHPAHSRSPSDEKFLVVSSDEYPQPLNGDVQPRHSGELFSDRRSDEQFHVDDRPSIHSSPSLSFTEVHRQSPPPLPPKTPLQSDNSKYARLNGPPVLPPAGVSRPRPPPGAPLPYPDTDGPPPIVNKATKPEFSR